MDSKYQEMVYMQHGGVKTGNVDDLLLPTFGVEMAHFD
jgi:hypothetical protein